MYRVNNQRAVRRLADRSFRASRSRNIIAVLAIALTALLFTALFTVGSGLIENILENEHLKNKCQNLGRCVRQAATVWRC